jgi:hypothetical protein
MRYQAEKEIEGVRYTISQFPARKAAKILTRLLKLVGEPLANFGGGLSTSIDKVLPLAVRALTEKLDEAEIDQLLTDLLSCVQIDEGNGFRSLIIDTDFQGKLGAMFKVVAASIEVNYSDFFGAIVGAFKVATAKTSLVEKPEIKSGTFGA